MFGKSKPPNPRQRLTDRMKQVTAPSPGDRAAPLDRREDRATRQAVFRNATITLDSGQKFTVVMKDMNSGGARIEFFQRNDLPESFLLSEPTLKLRRRVRLVWQRECVAGVKFQD